MREGCARCWVDGTSIRRAVVDDGERPNPVSCRVQKREPTPSRIHALRMRIGKAMPPRVYLSRSLIIALPNPLPACEKNHGLP